MMNGPSTCKATSMSKAMPENGNVNAPVDIDAICNLVANCFGADRERLAATTHLVQDLGFDSIDQLVFAVELELAFDVQVSDQALHSICTLGDAVPCVTDAIEMRQFGKRREGAFPKTPDRESTHTFASAYTTT